MTVDPLAREFPAWSPYNYAANNPLNVTDPDGMDWYCTTNDDGDCTSYRWNDDLTAANASEVLGEGQRYIDFGTTYTAESGLTVRLGQNNQWSYMESPAQVYAMARANPAFALGVISGDVPAELGLAPCGDRYTARTGRSLGDQQS